MKTRTEGEPRPARSGKLKQQRLPMSVATVALALVMGASTSHAQMTATYLHALSSFSGPLRYTTVQVSVDRDRDEIYVVYQNIVRVYNQSGMEIFSFGDDLDLGQVLDLAVDRDGSLILLSYKDSRSLLTRCSFRGEPLGPIVVRNLPEGMVFGANRLVLRNNRLYLVSLGSASVIVTDPDGGFREHLDLLTGIGEDERQKSGAELLGFDVDGAGNVYFTIPVHFKVYKRLPDGTTLSFGRSGSAPGRFGVVSGITSDSRGNLLVSDKSRSVIMAFDKDFRFLTEFGYRGSRPENLIVPDDIAIDERDRLYVAQARDRGVSVFALVHQ